MPESVWFPNWTGLRAIDRRHGWLWLLGLGLGLILVGLVTLILASAATISLVILLGVALVVAGAVELGRLLFLRRRERLALHLLSGLLYLVLGLVLLTRPLLGAEALTIAIVALLLLTGVIRVIAGLTLQLGGWGWMVATGVLNVILGIIIWAAWPFAALWVLGVFVGVELLAYGLTTCMLALMAKTVAGEIREEPMEPGRIAA